MTKLGLFSDPIVVDDTSLLRAIVYYEMTINPDRVGSFHYNMTGLIGMENIPPVIKLRVVDSEDFKVLRSNEHLRGLLRDFLEAKLAVAETRDQLKQMGPLKRIWNREKRLRLESRLKERQSQLENCFKKYEMLRKLTVSDNILLKRELESTEV